MNRLLTQVLWKKQNRWQFIAACGGFLVGICLILVAAQIFSDIDRLFRKAVTKEEKYAYLVLNKRIAPTALLLGMKTGFTEKEITSLKNQSFTADLGLVLYNQFKVQAYAAGYGTEIFFEAIPDRFMDSLPDNWLWQEGANFIPIVISKDFLTLYNFGFSQARGLPLLTADIVNLVPIEIDIQTISGWKTYQAKVVGLTERMQSILVPYSFMEWANSKYGVRSAKPEPNRLIIAVKNRANPEIAQYLNSNGYETNKDRLNLSNAAVTIQIVLGSVGGIGLLIIILSLIVILITFQLIVARSQERIQLLIDLGYTRASIVHSFIKSLGILMGLIYVAAEIILFASTAAIQAQLTALGLEVPPGVHPLLHGMGLLFVLAGLGLSLLSLFHTISRLYAAKAES